MSCDDHSALAEYLCSTGVLQIKPHIFRTQNYFYVVSLKVVPREEWLNTLNPQQELNVLMFNSSFIREIPKFLQRNFILMIQLNRGWFVVFLNASHLHAKFQSYDH